MKLTKLALHWQILIGMLIGAGIGLPLNLAAESGAVDETTVRTIAVYGKNIGDVFLRLLSMIVVPLILTSIISGVTSGGTLEGLGRMGGSTVIYYVSTSLLAICTGLLFVNLIQPGVGADLVLLQQSAAGETAVEPEVLAGGGLMNTMWNQLMNLIPNNPWAAIADPTNRSILAVIFFSILFGIFIVKVGGKSGRRLTEFFQDCFEVMMSLTMFLIRLAPIGVFGFMLYASAGKGLSVFASLGMYMVTVLAALLVHALVTLPLILWLFGRRRPATFARAMSPALLTGFSTASSNGTLPLTITCAEQRAGISNRVSSFVLPLGATINMDGTALYEAVAVLFIAQAYGNDLGLASQAVVAFTALLASIGAAGIPHAGTVMMVVVLGAVGLPLDAVGLILAVDRILDMCRTSVNLWSDSIATAVIGRLTGISPPPADAAAGPLTGTTQAPGSATGSGA
ncbi:MAG: dicarboxylate/amino acid:cation symporter [Planctomycetota bacterium]|jgi:Na+/H+-dicarboxylate symporter